MHGRGGAPPGRLVQELDRHQSGGAATTSCSQGEREAVAGRARGRRADGHHPAEQQVEGNVVNSPLHPSRTVFEGARLVATAPGSDTARVRLDGTLLRLGLVTVIFLGGCKAYDALYCDEDRKCTDSTRPFCDLTGAYPASEGIGRTCIPSPFDAGADIADAGSGDASAPHDATGDASVGCRWGRFSRLANVNTRDNESVGSLDAEGLTLYMARYRADGQSDIFVATRSTAAEAFGVPVEVVELRDDELQEYGPDISATDLEIFYASGLGLGPIMTASRETPTSTFSTPVSTDMGGLHPSLSGDGLSMYIVRNETVERRTRSKVGGSWSAPTSILPGDGYQSADVSPDELRLLLTNEDDDAPVLIAERDSVEDDFRSPVPLDADILPGGPYYLEATWNADQTQMIVATPQSGFGLDLFYSTCQ